MKKYLILFLAIVMSSIALVAENVPVKNRENKTVGTVTYSYRYQTSSRGCFTIITVSNQTGEYVKLSFGTNAGGAEGVNLRPYEENKEVIIGTTKTPTKVYVVGNEAQVD